MSSTKIDVCKYRGMRLTTGEEPRRFHANLPGVTVDVRLALSDWLLLATIVLVIPAYSYFNRRRLEEEGVKDRRSIYVRSMIVLWLLATITVYAWWRQGRALVALGFFLEPGAVATTAGAACLMALGAIMMRIRTTARLSPAKAAVLRDGIGGSAPILPRTKRELVWFCGLSISAGICEEVLYRGYFFAVAAPFVTVWGALAASSIAFGLAHIYQGIRGILLTAAVGLFLGGFYLATGSIVWPIVLHILIDLNGGAVGYLLYRDAPSDAVIRR
jgi:hypothetical protein